MVTRMYKSFKNRRNNLEFKNIPKQMKSYIRYLKMSTKLWQA